VSCKSECPFAGLIELRAQLKIADVAYVVGSLIRHLRERGYSASAVRVYGHVRRALLAVAL
jgi:hypothetical protein